MVPTPTSSETTLTMFAGSVQAGFPSPAADFAHEKINLNDRLLKNPNSSFLFRVAGESMTGIGIYSGDTLIVDRSITPTHNQIVVAVLDEEFTVKRLYMRENEIKLVSENSAFPDIVLKEGQELKVWGVVTFNIHKLLNI